MPLAESKNHWCWVCYNKYCYTCMFIASVEEQPECLLAHIYKGTKQIKIQLIKEFKALRNELVILKFSVSISAQHITLQVISFSKSSCY